MQGEDERVAERGLALGGEPASPPAQHLGVVGEAHHQVRLVGEGEHRGAVLGFDDLGEEAQSAALGVGQFLDHRGRGVEQHAGVDRQVAHPLETADLLPFAVLVGREIAALQALDRPAAAVDDRGVELDEVDVHLLGVAGSVDEDHVLGGAAVAQVGDGAHVGELGPAAEQHRLHEGRLVERGDAPFVEEELDAIERLALGQLDLGLGAQAGGVGQVGTRIDQPHAGSGAARR